MSINRTQSNTSVIQTEKPEPMMKPQMDANVYATRKTVVQGLMDVALLSSNASQLKYLLKKGPEHEFYVALLLMVIASITLQAISGCIFIVVGYTNFNHVHTHNRLTLLSNVSTVFVFMIALINVIMAGFGLDTSK